MSFEEFIDPKWNNCIQYNIDEFDIPLLGSP